MYPYFSQVTIGGTAYNLQNYTTKEGKPFIKFSVRFYDNKEAHFFNVTFFGKEAEKVQPFIINATPVVVTGSFNLYKDKNSNVQLSILASKVVVGITTQKNENIQIMENEYTKQDDAVTQASNYLSKANDTDKSDDVPF